MTIRRMTMDDLEMVLDWAAAEGWNPGLEDAAAFYASDPQGFLLNEVDGRPVAAISVVNHSDSFAFLGLYIAPPDHRGQGHGLAVWAAGIAHAGRRCIGLDGVPAQQDNYAHSGFRRSGRTLRLHGVLPSPVTGRTRPAGPADLQALYRADAQAEGVQRPRFARAWFTATAGRQTILLPGGAAPAFATWRCCREGTKVGPFHAATEDQARALLAALPAGSTYVDVPDSCTALTGLLRGMGFKAVFETARMYRGSPPTQSPPRFHAAATLELG